MGQDRTRLVGEQLAGALLGLLVGLLLGLSTSPVVGTVVGALVALLATFVGRPAGDAEPRVDEAGKIKGPLGPVSYHRLAAFALLCVIGILAGLILKTHNLLAPSLADQVESWKQAGFSEREAKQLVAFRELGVVQDSTGMTSKHEMSPVQLSTSLSSAKQSDCSDLQPQRFGDDAGSTLSAYRKVGGRWAEFAESLAQVPQAVQLTVIRAAWNLACE